MVGMDCKARMVPTAGTMPMRSPKLDTSQQHLQLPGGGGGCGIVISSPRPACQAATSAYEHYLRLPELRKLWTSRDFPGWKNEPVVKSSLQALEITFRLISVVLSDPRPYINSGEWIRRLDSLASHQIELIAIFCQEDDAKEGAPVCDLKHPKEGVLTRDRSSQEVWKLPGATPVVNRTSEASLLPRLAAWEKSEELATKIMFEIECQMRRAPFTLGLGEPNLTGKPNLEYDLVCRPAALHTLKKSLAEPYFTSSKANSHQKNHENDTLYNIHQVLESWLFVAEQLLSTIPERIQAAAGGSCTVQWEKAASNCWALERIWKLLSEIEDLHLLMDPDDFLRLKNQLAIKATTTSPSGSLEAFCFRSTSLMDVTRSSKELKQQVPSILGVEVDPDGGPRVQEAAMRLFHGRRRGGEEADDEVTGRNRIHLLQALQATDAAVKKFFFSYRQMVVVVMGSPEAGITTSSSTGTGGIGTSDPLAQIFSEPPYFPSLDAAKTFLGEYWQHRHHHRRGNTSSIGTSTDDSS